MTEWEDEGCKIGMLQDSTILCVAELSFAPALHKPAGSGGVEVGIETNTSTHTQGP